MQKHNPEKLATKKVHKTKDKNMLENTERVIKMDNPEKLAT